MLHLRGIKSEGTQKGQKMPPSSPPAAATAAIISVYHGKGSVCASMRVHSVVILGSREI